MNSPAKVLFSGKEIERALKRMAHEIVEYNRGVENLALIGIRTGGVPVAERLQRYIKEIEGKEIPVGFLDINLYRDDWSRLAYQPVVHKTEIPFAIDDMNIVLADDVIYTGRTIRAAMDALADLGRPKQIQLAVLVDRGRRELPIQPDFVGFRVRTSGKEHVNCYFQETSGRDEVLLKNSAS